MEFKDETKGEFGEGKSFRDGFQGFKSDDSDPFDKSGKNPDRKLNARLALARSIRENRRFSNEISGQQESTGDAFYDGKQGLAGSILQHMNPLYYLKSWLMKIAAVITPAITFYLAIVLIFLVIVIFLMDFLLSFESVGNAVTDYFNIASVHTTSMRNTPFDQEEIDAILEDMDLTAAQEAVLRFAYSKVGYPYSQANRTSGWAYDCSSLAYYAWKSAGVDISDGSGYPPTAAYGAQMLGRQGKSIDADTFSLQPGDLIYYGGGDNGRYKGIYHVAIYVGNGIAIEALNEKYGVVYQNLRTNHIVMVCRPG